LLIPPTTQSAWQVELEEQYRLSPQSESTLHETPHEELFTLMHGNGPDDDESDRLHAT
jgi:hypothetical protein